METPHASNEVPKKPAERRAWIKYQLDRKGLSFAAVARKNGVSPQAVKETLFKPNAHLEEALAAELNTPVRVLFWERFDDSGRRLHQVRVQQRSGIRKVRKPKATRRAN